MQRKTGARGLRTIIENILLDTMYELPSADDITSVVVDESVILGESEPFLVYENKNKIASADT
jgi:ATP-dependent Clp protease ATP-binding subunit ClpX